jgi:hypothetical protein
MDRQDTLLRSAKIERCSKGFEIGWLRFEVRVSVIMNYYIKYYISKTVESPGETTNRQTRRRTIAVIRNKGKRFLYDPMFIDESVRIIIKCLP